MCSFRFLEAFTCFWMKICEDEGSFFRKEKTLVEAIDLC